MSRQSSRDRRRRRDSSDSNSASSSSTSSASSASVSASASESSASPSSGSASAPGSGSNVSNGSGSDHSGSTSTLRSAHAKRRRDEPEISISDTDRDSHSNSIAADSNSEDIQDAQYASPAQDCEEYFLADLVHSYGTRTPEPKGKGTRQYPQSVPHQRTRTRTRPHARSHPAANTPRALASSTRTLPADLGEYDQYKYQDQEEDINDMPIPNRRKTSWGGAVVSGAVTAAVVTAAVGLTAYRLWKGWGDVQPAAEDDDDDIDEEDEEEDGLADAGGDAYCRTHGRDHYGHEHNIHGQAHAQAPGHQLATPPESHRSSVSGVRLRSPRRRRKRAQRPSIAELMIVTARRDADAAPAVLPATPTMSPSSAPVAKSPAADRANTDDSDDDDDDGMNARLDQMTRRLQGLIAEGQAALASPRGKGEKTASASSSRSQSASPSPPASPTPARPASVSTRTNTSTNTTTTNTSTSSTATTSIGLGAPPGAVFHRRASSGPVRPLPPLPWRRDPSSGTAPRWVQRPLSPAPERGPTPAPPPVPPIPPELAHAVAALPPSRPSSIVSAGGVQRRISKRNSAPPKACTPEGQQQHEGQGPPTNGTPLGKQSPASRTHTPTGSISRIPRHVRTPSVVSPPASPTPASARNPSNPSNASNALVGSIGKGKGGLDAPFGSSMSSASSTSASTSSSVPRRTVSLDWRAGSPNQRTIPTARAAFEPLTTGIVATRVAAIAEAPKPDTNTQATASESQLHPNSHSPSSSLSASTGSGRSRIPVRRSIDPDVFATFGRS